MGVIAYKAYAKENLLAITLKIEKKENVKEASAYLRFSRGFASNTSSATRRSYNTQEYISLKFTLLELAALGKAFKYAASHNGNSTFVKISNSSLNEASNTKEIKRVALDKQYLTASAKERFIGIRFTRYEMEAISDDIKQMVELANSILWRENEQK